jgi:hypothetical protein
VATDKQRAFCRHYVANGCIASRAAKSAGYADHRPTGSKLLKTRAIRAELERLKAIAAKTTNKMLADAIGNDQPDPIDVGLAASLVACRGTDDDARKHDEGSINVLAVSCCAKTQQDRDRWARG